MKAKKKKLQVHLNLSGTKLILERALASYQPVHTQLHSPTPSHTHPHPPIKMLQTVTPTHKCAVNSHTHPKMSPKQSHSPINLFQKGIPTHKCALNSHKQPHPFINVF